MTHNELKEKYLERTQSYFEEACIEYDREAISQGFIQDVITGKEGLRKLLNGDKVYVGEAYEIKPIKKHDIFFMGISAGYDADFIFLTFAPIARDLFSDTMSGGDNKFVEFHDIHNEYEHHENIEELFRLKVEKYLLEADKEEVYKKFQRIYKEGVKTSKLLSVIFGNEKLNIAFSKIQQACHKLPIYLGVRPIDYLTMSDGNSWSSCQSIQNNGCYSAAPCVLGADKTTLIAWAGDDEQNKEWRQMWFVDVDKKIILSSRAYPNVNDSAATLVEKYLTKLMFGENPEDLVKFGGDNVTKYHYTGNDCFYHDVLCGYTDGVIAVMDSETSERYEQVVIGAEGHGLLTGEVIYDESSPYARGSYVCEHCGCHMNEDEAWSTGDGYYACEECHDDYYTTCENCGESELTESMFNVDGDYYCENCLANMSNITQCDNCGEYHYKSNMKLGSDGDFYCQDCEDDMPTETEEQE